MSGLPGIFVGRSVGRISSHGRGKTSVSHGTPYNRADSPSFSNWHRVTMIRKQLARIEPTKAVDGQESGMLAAAVPIENLCRLRRLHYFIRI